MTDKDRSLSKVIVGALADIELAASTGTRRGGLVETASSKEID